MRRRLSGFRAALIVGALLLTVGTGLAGFLSWRHVPMLRPEEISKLGAVGRSVAEQVGLALDYGIPFGAITGMPEFLAAMAQPNPEIAYMAVTDVDGRVLYRLGTVPSVFPPAAADQAAEFRDGYLDVAVPVPTDGGLGGSVHLGMHEGFSIAIWPFLVAGLAALAASAITAIAVMIFTRRAIDRPLARVREVLEAAAHGDLSDALDDKIGSAEMGAMLQAVRRRVSEQTEYETVFRQEIEEIAVAQPDAEGRRVIHALAEGVGP